MSEITTEQIGSQREGMPETVVQQTPFLLKLKVRPEKLNPVLKSLLAFESKKKYPNDPPIDIVLQTDKTTPHLKTDIVDPAHVAMISIKIDKRYFEEFVTFPGEFGLPVAKLYEAMKGGKVGDVVSIGIEGATMTVKEGFKTATIKTIDTLNLHSAKVPVLNLPASFTIRAKEFIEAVLAIEKTSENIDITVSPDGVQLESHDCEEPVKAVFEKYTLECLDAKEFYKTSYPLYYLKEVLKPLRKISKKLTVTMGSDYPIKISVDMEDHISFELLVAPRIEEA